LTGLFPSGRPKSAGSQLQASKVLVNSVVDLVPCIRKVAFTDTGYRSSGDVMFDNLVLRRVVIRHSSAMCCCCCFCPWKCVCVCLCERITGNS
jgi:hypothetical protein